MNPQAITDPSGRYARYLHQWNRYTTTRGELATAQARREQVRDLRRVHRAHRHEMTAQAQSPRWWPFSTRRQTQARYAAQRAMDVVEATTYAVNELGKLIEMLTAQREQAHQAATEARAEWEAEYAARERFEAGDEPRDHTERGLFAEFAKQDEQGRRGPEGRRMEEALNRFNQLKPARTDEEREWYREWAELEWEKVPTMDELAEQRQAERERRYHEDEAPF
ncbi:hypothetical protein NE857_33790 (plasmid) [Nocardiopsis exhalans]|uniref:Uncharacterized protein n=1 Tax=Nocardiopsis exhalans TaxID=163604 RepID=A0ABY5DJ61_9ACTN|nr:hypothetical protein [Nocardiopsis exhalans]USY23604.1 hypothetical protein NE857_33790 [Nocardiopsis exhalans]